MRSFRRFKSSVMISALLYLLAGLLALWFMRRTIATVRASRDWPTVPGRILERGLGDALGDHAYAPRVKYAYAVDGVEYVNDQVYPIRLTGSLAWQVRRLVDRLPDELPVHYDPARPAGSYLVPQPMSTLWLGVALGVLAIAIGLMQLLVATAGGA